MIPLMALLRMNTSAFGEKGVGREFVRHLEVPRVPVRVHSREVEHARKDVSARRPRHPQDCCNSPYALHYQKLLTFHVGGRSFYYIKAVLSALYQSIKDRQLLTSIVRW